ncbi:hypothetical protein T11_16430 [Trichinella zimbabwensis]|uniref:Uncharacterized protein n=1 Tax=Trichinella zimbabwensis TaxID=268475 RepID=A0A0V1H3C1_9BILA|nr:hypothetical protein T11_16430 [Trichinella zimbabwensis]
MAVPIAQQWCLLVQFGFVHHFCQYVTNLSEYNKNHYTLLCWSNGQMVSTYVPIQKCPSQVQHN